MGREQKRNDEWNFCITALKGSFLPFSSFPSQLGKDSNGVTKQTLWWRGRPNTQSWVWLLFDIQTNEQTKNSLYSRSQEDPKICFPSLLVALTCQISWKQRLAGDSGERLAFLDKRIRYSYFFLLPWMPAAWTVPSVTLKTVELKWRKRLGSW